MTINKNVNNKSGTAARAPSVRLRRSPEAARDNILGAAETILTARGPMDLKLSEVAGEAGVATATVLHHFGSIDGVQAALMERMVTGLATRIIAINQAAPPGQALTLEGAQALFDAFEAQGAARLAAWLVMTGQAKRLSVVRRAVNEVLDRMLANLPHPPPREDIEDVMLAGITTALGAGLFGESLSVLLGRAPDSARQAAIAMLAAGAAVRGLG